jgi:hypothetical protein
MLNYTPDWDQIKHINLANNQVSHNIKIKSVKEIRQSNPPTTNQKYSGITPSEVMGRRRRREGKQFSQKNDSIKDSVGNEENGYLVLDLNKTVKNVTNELSDPYKKTLKK